MKKILLIMGLSLGLSLSGLAQRADEKSQFKEVSQELSYGIDNIEKSVDTYSKNKVIKDKELEKLAKNSIEILRALQDARTAYNQRKLDENYYKLKELESQFDKSNYQILGNLSDSISIDIEYLTKLSKDCYLLSTQYAKFQAIYSSINNRKDVEALKEKIGKVQLQVKNSAGLAIDIIDKLTTSKDEKEKLESTLRILQNEFANKGIQKTEEASIDSDFDKSLILKDASCQMANYAVRLSISQKALAFEALKVYQSNLSNTLPSGIVGEAKDVNIKLGEMRVKREARLLEYKKNKELYLDSAKKVNRDELDKFLQE